ncbi:MAG: hypothetical protein ACPG08_06925 [Flavobacteriales bacterium]
MFGRLSLPIKSIGFVALALSLFSCEGNTRLEWNLQNLSAGDVYVVHKAWDYSSIPPDTVSIAAGETYLLGVNDVLGGNSIPWDPASFIDTLFVTSAAGALCTKDWTNTENWGIVSQEERRIPSRWSHTYFFRVEDADF